jgi:hypothetical protein
MGFCSIFLEVMMKIILISGKANSGKTKLGEFILKYAKIKNINAIQTEYSKYLKLYAKEIIGYDGSRENKPRKFLQDLGTYIREDLNMPHFFTKRMLEDFKIYEKFVDIVVISDVRLKEEIEDLKNSQYNDIITIRVNNKNLFYNLTEEEKTHITETALENYPYFDYIIENKSLNELEDFAKKIIEGEI